MALIPGPGCAVVDWRLRALEMKTERKNSLAGLLRRLRYWPLVFDIQRLEQAVGQLLAFPDIQLFEVLEPPPDCGQLLGQVYNIANL